MSRRRGFTLIELLVVIAIIAILAAILFPVFTTARQAGMRATCQSNVKMILQAATMYESDANGGILPGWVDYNGNGSPWSVAEDNLEHWPSMVDPYIKQLKKGEMGPNMEGVYVCPSRFRSKYLETGRPIDGYLQRTYGYNWGYLGGYSQKYHTQGEVAKPTKTIRILENWRFDDPAWDWATQGCGSEFCYPPVLIGAYCTPTSTWPPGWHNGRSSVGWFDGHVTCVKLPPPGTTPANQAYVGILEKGPSGMRDPYFRLEHPKP